MDLENLELTDNLRNDFFYLGVSLLIVLAAVGFHNVTTPDNPPKVGMVELETNCFGVDAGLCLGIQRLDHTTYNYDNYTDPEPGTDNYYRLVESELMLQAQNICDNETRGMEWASEASYENQTGEEWLENENVDLLSCEQVPHRSMDAE